MLEIGRVTPDDIWTAKSPGGATWTFICTANNNLYFNGGQMTHVRLMEENPELIKELNYLLGTDITSGGKLDAFALRSYIKTKPIAVAGRTGNVRCEDEKYRNVCSFWDNPGLNKISKPCVQELLKHKLIDDNFLINLPTGYYSYTPAEFIAGTYHPDQLIHPDEKRKLAIHLLKGLDKKQALQYAGATPTPRNSSLNPGEKYWALSSENFSFKDWLNKC